jgi:hypothetical protein
MAGAGNSGGVPVHGVDHPTQPTLIERRVAPGRRQIGMPHQLGDLDQIGDIPGGRAEQVAQLMRCRFDAELTEMAADDVPDRRSPTVHSGISIGPSR